MTITRFGVCLSSLCLAACGSRSIGNDSCAGETCSDHGVCALVEGQTRCLCDEGFEASGMLCLTTGGGTWPPDGNAWLGLTVPAYDSLSLDGQYGIYATMTPAADSPTQLVLGSLKLRTMSTGTDLTLVEHPVFVCGMGGCGPSDRFVWLQSPGWLIHHAYDGTTNTTGWQDLNTDTQGTFTLVQFERIVVVLPDATGAISIKQTYAAQNGAIRYHAIPSGTATTVTATINDPAVEDIAVGSVGGTNWVGVHAGSRYSTTGQSLILYALPGMTAVDVGSQTATRLTFVGDRLVFDDFNTATVASVPMSGSPVATLGSGSWVAVAPDGRHVVLRGTTVQVAPVDGSAAPVDVPVTGVPAQVVWQNPDTLLLVTDGVLSSFTLGAGSLATLEENVGRVVVLADGLLVVGKTPPGAVAASLTDGTVSMSVPLTSATPAHVSRGAARIDLGAALQWQAAGSAVLENRLYVDVLNGFAADPNNGTAVLTP